MSSSSSSETQPSTPWVDQELPEPYTPPDLEKPMWADLIDHYVHGAADGPGSTSWVVSADFGDEILNRFPSERVNALQHRLFLHRAVRYMSGQGVKQFIDIGPGLMSPYSTHRVLETWYMEQGIRPSARTCYVENNSTVAARVTTGAALDGMKRPRRTIMVEGDLRRPDELRTEIEHEELIDFDAPVGLVVTGTMQHEQRNRQGQEVGPQALQHFAGNLAAGSYMAVSHAMKEDAVSGNPVTAELITDIQATYNSTSIGPVMWRSRSEIESLPGKEYRTVGEEWGPAELWGQEYTGPNAPLVVTPPNYPVVWAGVSYKDSLR